MMTGPPWPVMSKEILLLGNPFFQALARKVLCIIERNVGLGYRTQREANKDALPVPPPRRCHH